MTPEIAALAAALLLQVAQFAHYAVVANREMGTGYTMGPRDAPPERDMSEGTARLRRAFENHFEGLVLFMGAVTVVTLAGQATPVTAALAWIYVAARVLYVPAYALGLRPWRSIVWFIGFLATIFMTLAALI